MYRVAGASVPDHVMDVSYDMTTRRLAVPYL